MNGRMDGSIPRRVDAKTICHVGEIAELHVCCTIYKPSVKRPTSDTTRVLNGQWSDIVCLPQKLDGYIFQVLFCHGISRHSLGKSLQHLKTCTLTAQLPTASCDTAKFGPCLKMDTIYVKLEIDGNCICSNRAKEVEPLFAAAQRRSRVAVSEDSSNPVPPCLIVLFEEKTMITVPGCSVGSSE